MAEGLCERLQIFLERFNSSSRLRFTEGGCLGPVKGLCKNSGSSVAELETENLPRLVRFHLWVFGFGKPALRFNQTSGDRSIVKLE